VDEGGAKNGRSPAFSSPHARLPPAISRCLRVARRNAS
jgi:hypothetical protein